MPDKEVVRQNVRDAFGRFMTGGEEDLDERLYPPDYVNHEASGAERGARRGEGHRRVASIVLW